MLTVNSVIGRNVIPYEGKAWVCVSSTVNEVIIKKNLLVLKVIKFKINSYNKFIKWKNACRTNTGHRIPVSTLAIYIKKEIL